MGGMGAVQLKRSIPPRREPPSTSSMASPSARLCAIESLLHVRLILRSSPYVRLSMAHRSFARSSRFLVWLTGTYRRGENCVSLRLPPTEMSLYHLSQKKM